MSDYVKNIGYFYSLDGLENKKIVAIAEALGQENDGDVERPYFYSRNENEWHLRGDENSDAFALVKITVDEYEAVDVYKSESLGNFMSEFGDFIDFIYDNNVDKFVGDINPDRFNVFTMVYHNCCESPLTFKM